MDPRTWLEDNGPEYVALMAVSFLGVVLLISTTVLKLAGISFEPIDPLLVAALTAIFGVLAMEHSNSGESENGA